MIIVILATGIFFTIISTPLHACQISLEGIHSFSCGDDLQWADPEFDDKNWMQIDVPASWQSQGLNPLPHIG